jgi:hypothetical protein
MNTINVMTRRMRLTLAQRKYRTANLEKCRNSLRTFRVQNGPEAPEYAAFHKAKHRCTNPNSCKWKDYGERGIRFLFTSFEQFLAEIGPRPEGKFSLDRIDNDGNYEPGNVRWATMKEQMANKKRAA